MKKVIGVMMLAFCFLCFQSEILYADPWATGDPKAGVNLHKVTAAPAGFTTAPETLANGQLALDFAALPVGAFVVKVIPCNSDPIWGEACGPEYSFTGTRPSLAAPAIISGGKIQRTKPVVP